MIKTTDTVNRFVHTASQLWALLKNDENVHESFKFNISTIAQPNQNVDMDGLFEKSK